VWTGPRSRSVCVCERCGRVACVAFPVESLFLRPSFLAGVADHGRGLGVRRSGGAVGALDRDRPRDGGDGARWDGAAAAPRRERTAPIGGM